MLPEIKGFEFGEFFLDPREKVLLRGSKILQITPKAFQLLLVLVENHGRLLEKSALMKTVWANDFVEESNLPFTIRLLRVILEDETHHPSFIETVPRRGYRFIAEVREIFTEDDSAETSSQPIEEISPVSSPFKKFLLPASLGLSFFILTVFWYYGNPISKPNFPVLSAPFASEKLSTTGKVFNAIISPDGKNVIYTNQSEGKQSVWLRQLESANNVEIIPPAEDFYGGLALSPDGNFLYFTRKPRYFEGQTDIYRVSIFGGVPTRIVGETQGWISLSPDGSKISFVRCYYRQDEFCSLWMADALDGKNERKLASRPALTRIAANKISPDGKTIVFAAGQSENQANEFSLVEVEIESGRQRELTNGKFFNIKNLEWLPNQSGLFITASRVPNKNFLIWQVSTATGEVRPLTNDSETYSALSMDKAASMVVTTKIQQDFRLRLLNLENPSGSARILADAVSVAFAPNGKIIFSSMMTGNGEIWSINADGSEQRQLTNNLGYESSPVVSSDNNSIFFSSNRTGEVQIWRMNADGSNQKQITLQEGGYPLSVSLDGKWLYYHSGRERLLRRVSTSGSEEQLIVNKRKYRFAVSPDGLQAAFAEKQNQQPILKIISLPGEQTIKTFKVDGEKSQVIEIKWSADGKSLVYVLADSEFKNNTLWRQSLDKETADRIADLGDEAISELSGFAVSPDGKSFVFVQGGWKHDVVLLRGLK